MGWKNWPNWIKGILIPAGLYILVIILGFILFMIGFGFNINFLAIPGVYILYLSGLGLYVLIPLVIIGAIIGWVIDKRKSRK